MIPKVVTDAGYTAVGLGVLAIQQVQVRRRATRARLREQVDAAREGVGSAVGQARERIGPFAARLEPMQAKVEPLRAKVGPLRAKVEPPLSAALDRVPRIPGPIGTLVASGTGKLQAALHADTGREEPAPAAKPAGRSTKAGTRSRSTGAAKKSGGTGSAG